MRKIAQATVLTAFSTLLGLIPLTASAQIAPDRIVICSSLSRRATFKLDGKEEALEAKQCRTYSRRSTYLFYTYYLHNPLNGGMQYRRMVPTSLKRVLSGGEQYDFQTRSSGYLDIVKKVDIIPKNYLLPDRADTPDVRSIHITLHPGKIFTHF